MVSPLLKGLLESGAPWGLLCAVLLAAVVVLWRRGVQLSDKLYDLATNQVKTNAETASALAEARRELETLRRMF